MRRRCFLLLAATVVVGCGSDSSTGPSQASIVGTWELKTINGTALPFVVAQVGTNKVELLSDVFTINAGGSFTQTTTVRSTVNGQASTSSEADAGSYTLNGTAVTLKFNSDGSTGTASWSGNTMTTTDGGFALVYTRR
jgi:hypothetical protein